MILDKTNYVNYLVCARYGWQIFHKKDKFESAEKEQAYQQGYQVENLAKRLFQSGHEIIGDRQKSLEQTRVFTKHPEVKILYQATALSPDNLLAKADIMVINEKRDLDLYEVKMTNDIGLKRVGKNDKKKWEKYLNDVAFQRMAFERSGYKINRTFLIHMNKEYRLKEEVIDPNKFFKQVDISKEVSASLKEVSAKIQEARYCYEKEQEPECRCYLKPKKDRCEAFEKFNPKLANEDSIFNLSNIRIGKLLPLYEKNILKIKEINEDIISETKFSQQQLNHIKVVKTQQPIIEKEQISQSLGEIKEPIYFLDYEAINYPIPVFKNSKPFQQVPFQFSLYILKNKDEEPLYEEFLMKEASDESLEELIASLRKCISDRGSIVVWHQGAEKNFQNNLSSLFPKNKLFFDDLNRRIFDLKTIFSNQQYVHPDFKGKTSLKNVVPVLTPDLNYSDLNINEGRMASRMWDQALREPEEKKAGIFADLLNYCKYDTLAMVKIYKLLRKIAGG